MPLSTTMTGLFIELVRLGIGNASPQEAILPENCDWDSLEAFAEEQGLDAVVWDGLKRLSSSSLQIPEQLRFQWEGGVVVYFEHCYEVYQRDIAELAGFYHAHHFRMMVLKGYACSLDWPRPDHRPTGDIDIWMFGDQRAADDVLEHKTGIKVDTSHHHHTVFHWRHFMVENHYDFINVHHHKSNVSLEKLFKNLAQDDTHYVYLLGEKVYLPSPNLHALFLLCHAKMHFAADRISLRHLLDWAFHVKAHGAEIDWDWLTGVLEEYGMKELFHIFNAICIEDLGFEPTLFPTADINRELKRRVLQDILSPAIPDAMPEQLLKRVVWKIHRWKANEWKHRLCYKESMWSAFWSGVWNHLLKPASI